ncbi:hypothetical protein BKP54_31030 [Ensifer sp. 1H6]|nr:hypothetical protein BKP54_31030 [Ensifer sp. 1H6]
MTALGGMMPSVQADEACDELADWPMIEHSRRSSLFNDAARLAEARTAGPVGKCDCHEPPAPFAIDDDLSACHGLNFRIT